MLHIREDYNRRVQDSANLIPADEPVMLLRAQDEFVPNLLRQYANLNYRQGKLEFAEKVWEHVLKMEEWRTKHGSKLPDYPGEPAPKTLPGQTGPDQLSLFSVKPENTH